MDKCNLTIKLNLLVSQNEDLKEKILSALTEYLEKLRRHKLGNECHEESESFNGVKIITDCEYIWRCDA